MAYVPMDDSGKHVSFQWWPNTEAIGDALNEASVALQKIKSNRAARYATSRVRKVHTEIDGCRHELAPDFE